MKKEEVLADIEVILNQLTENAKALKEASMYSSCTLECDALKKAQESLLAKLLHRQALIDEKQKALKSLRKEAVEKKIVSYAKSLKKRRQKAASRRRASSKSST